MSVVPGIEILAGRRASLVRGARVGLLAHPASIGRDFRPAAALLAEAGARPTRLFAPEHGALGAAQDMIGVDERRDPLTGLPVVSLYGTDEASLAAAPEAFDGLDALVVDLADVGARYYTFAATAIRALPAAAARGVRVIVADRPNPLGGEDVEGNDVEPRFHSFVSELSIPNRHGLTLGELCLWAARTRGIDVALEVVPAEGWRRADCWDETGLPWVLPSPNMPTLDTALVYPGMCLVEGTNLSEGRGTTRPFELAGAPWLDPGRLAARLDAFRLPGVAFRPTVFRPAFHKHAGRDCGGVQIHVTDRATFRPTLTGLAFVAACRAEDPERFGWRTETYEFVSDRLAFDLLAGGEGWRRGLEAGADPRELACAWGPSEAAFRAARADLLLYRA